MPAAFQHVDRNDQTWPLPWVPLNDQGREQLTAELAAELAPGHSLFGVASTVVARCRTCDHVVVVTPDAWLIVHLTWAQPDRPPWPDVSFLAESKFELLIMTAEDGHDEGH